MMHFKSGLARMAFVLAAVMVLASCTRANAPCTVNCPGYLGNNTGAGSGGSGPLPTPSDSTFGGGDGTAGGSGSSAGYSLGSEIGNGTAGTHSLSSGFMMDSGAAFAP